MDSLDRTLHRVTYSGEEGYRVKARNKRRIGIDGRESNSSTVTNITIDQRTEHSEEELDQISVDEILDRKLGYRRKDQRSPYGEATVTAFRSDSAHTSRTVDEAGEQDMLPRYQQEDTHENIPEEPQSPTQTKAESQRPVSNKDVKQNIETLYVSTNANDTNWKKEPPRVNSGKRPPPAKPSLHKSSAATGASVGNTKGGDPSYIQIVQPLDIPSDNVVLSAESPTMSTVIQSVKQYNDMSSNHSIPPPSSPTETEKQESRPESPKNLTVRSMSPTKELLAKAEEPSNPKYAFNIPTADIMSDSTSMFSDYSEEPGELQKSFALSKPRQTPVQEEGEDEMLEQLQNEVTNIPKENL